MPASSLLSAATPSTGKKVRVLVVDDSVVIRKLVSQALSEEPDFEVVGTAPNGIIALQRLAQLKPDAITLDIEMPEMDGLETLRRIRKLDAKLPVIMFSTLTQRGASATLDALSLGASDYVTKAANVGSLEKSMESLRSELVPKIKQFFRTARPPVAAKIVPKPIFTAKMPLVQAPARCATVGKPKIVVIGVSTGGPTALSEVMPMFPRNFPLPILIVQHMPPLFTRLLAERLSAMSQIRIEESANGNRLEPGKAILAAGGFHMRARNSAGGVTVSMDQEAPENSCRPAVDVMFRSVAEIYGGAAVAVILTGMGFDGLRGAQTLKEQGAYVIAQDEASSVVWGMPGAVAKAGIANAIVSLSHIVPEILKQV